MLIIRKTQLEALSRSMVRQFERRMAQRLKAAFPEESRRMGDAALLGFVQSCIKAGASYKILLEENLEKYIDLAMEAGPDFGRKPEYAWAVTILRRDDLHENTKMKMIEFRRQRKARGTV